MSQWLRVTDENGVAYLIDPERAWRIEAEVELGDELLVHLHRAADDERRAFTAKRVSA